MPLEPPTVVLPVRVRERRPGDTGEQVRTVAYRAPCDRCTWNKAFPTVRLARDARAEHLRAVHGRPLR